MTPEDEGDGRALRGQEILARFEALGVKVTQVAREADLTRQTVYAVFNGTASPESMDAVEAALHRIATDQREHPEDYAVSTSEDMSVVELHGVFGVKRVVIRSRPDLLEEEILAVVRALSSAGDLLPGNDE